jgi:hypothetical protein
MFPSTTAENFQSWDRFLDVYYEPIRTALSLVPFIGEGRADDLAQSFFLKMYDRGFLAKRPLITGRFRDWLYVAARRHAVDEWRKTQRRPEHSNAFDVHEPVDQNVRGLEHSTFDADELYALSVLHLTVGRVHRQLLAEGKPEHWMIFEELVLAPLIPGRVPKTRAELMAMFPGQEPGFLDNRVTTVKRIFRRVLPALIPADPTENLTPEERFQELLAILQSSKDSRLWLAFLTDPRPGPDQITSSSLDLAAWPAADDRPEAGISQDILDDELRVLLGFWLDAPVHEYLDDLEAVGPILAAAIRETRPSGARGRRRDAASAITLKGLISGTDPVVSTVPPAELIILFRRLKEYAKRVHRSLSYRDERDLSRGLARRESSMPGEVAQVLYNLAGALALIRCGVRIIGLGDDQYRKNVAWVLDQRWLDPMLRPAFSSALQRIDSPRPS